MDTVVAFAPLVVLALIVLWVAIRIVPEYQRLVVFRLGRSIGQKGPGVVLLWPLIDRAVRVDLRELFLDIPQQTCITRDNAPINIDFLVYWRVMDPVASVVNVQDFAGASQGIATTTLRAVVGDIPLDDVLAKREQINLLLRTKLDEVTERWGVKVTSVEIREIQPPAEVQQAMNKQMAAERSRRALVLEADGTREAAIKVAEGDKQSAILKAEGDRQATILRAEADRQAAVLRAEGFAIGLQTMYQVAQHIDAKTMGLQYLDVLRSLGGSPATKILFPLEFTTLLRPFVGAGTPGDGGTARG
jgi:regulator of protease activity HflC (stomatin/prohibitin superfamily)